MIKKSFATSKPYVRVQVRTYGGNDLHVQIEGHKGNREYGFAKTFKADGEAVEFVKALEGTNGESMAGTGAKYTEAQARPRKDTIHFQVAGTVLKGEPLPEWVAKAKAILPSEVFAKVAPSVVPPAKLGNRGYGIAFDIPRKGNEDLWQYLAESIIFSQR